MKKVSLYVDDTLWQQLRLGCVQRHTSASAQIGLLVADLVAQWQQATPALPPPVPLHWDSKEPTHV
jgi:hypothetical protein